MHTSDGKWYHVKRLVRTSNSAIRHSKPSIMFLLCSRSELSELRLSPRSCDQILLVATQSLPKGKGVNVTLQLGLHGFMIHFLLTSADPKPDATIHLSVFQSTFPCSWTRLRHLNSSAWSRNRQPRTDSPTFCCENHGLGHGGPHSSYFVFKHNAQQCELETMAW